VGSEGPRTDRISSWRVTAVAHRRLATRLQFVEARRRGHRIGDAIDEQAKLGVFPSGTGNDLKSCETPNFSVDESWLS
jgi:hypothetical protein